MKHGKLLMLLGACASLAFCAEAGTFASSAWAKCTGCGGQGSYVTGPFTLRIGKRILMENVYDYDGPRPPLEYKKFTGFEPEKFEWKNTGLNEQRCASPGQSEGVVTTEPMVLETAWINAKRKEVGVLERPASGSLIATFTCGMTLYELRGSVIGVVTPVNKVIGAKESLGISITVNAETGDNTVTRLEGGTTTHVLELQEDGGGFQQVGLEDPGTLEPAPGTTLEVKAGSAKKPPTFAVKPVKK